MKTLPEKIKIARQGMTVYPPEVLYVANTVNQILDYLSEKEGEPHLYPMCKHGVVKTVDCEKCLPQEPKQVDVVDRIIKEIVKREEAYHFSQENLKKYREFREIIRIALD